MFPIAGSFQHFAPRIVAITAAIASRNPNFRGTSIGLVCALLLSASCSSTRISAREEAQASSATFQWLRQQHGIVNTPGLSELLTRVTSRIGTGINTASAQRLIAPAAGVASPAALLNSWQVFVLDTPELNAFSLGSGVVVITRGMLQALPSEAALAAVLSHEFAHQLLGHTQAALKAAERGSEAPLQPRGDAAHGNGPHAAFSLEQELAADTLGVQLLYFSRYRLDTALTTLSLGYPQYRSEQEKVSDTAPDWLSARAANLKAQIRSFPPLAATESSREFNRVRRSLDS